ncbi:MAG TPA: hypothetical protein VF920_16275, partial [Dongiaceae bacterium]
HLSALQNHDLMIPLIALPLLLLGPKLVLTDLPWFRPIIAKMPAMIEAAGLMLLVVVALTWQSDMATAVVARPIGMASTLGAKIALATEPEHGPGVSPGDLAAADAAIWHQMIRAQDLLVDLPDGAHVVTLEFANVALASWPRVHPGPHSLLWYQYQRSFSESYYPAPDQAFAGADVILVPRTFTTDSTAHLVNLYQPWLDQHAGLIEQNEFWRLYRPFAQPSKSTKNDLKNDLTDQASQ